MTILEENNFTLSTTLHISIQNTTLLAIQELIMFGWDWEERAFKGTPIIYL